MSVKRILQAAAGNITSGAQGIGEVDVDSVFSAYPYVGNNSAKTIINNVSLYGPLASSGDALYTTPGTFNWTCPAGVVYVDALCVGGGGNGLATGNVWASSGGGGGGFAWKNDIPVVPGNTYTVVVGATASDSYFINTTTVRGIAGSSAVTISGGGNGGGWVGDGGKNGGPGGAGDSNSSRAGAGGGGAGNRSVNGGAGGNSIPGTNGGAGGNGVELYGVATNTPGGSANGSGNVSGTNGQSYGAGGGGHASNGSSGWSPGIGASGAVRLVWGEGRAFPNTNVGTSQIPDPAVGGMVWLKPRSGTYGTQGHGLFDTVRGSGNLLATDSTAAQTSAGNILQQFNSNGFVLSNSAFNDATTEEMSWTFKKAPNFFDVVTYIGNGTTQTVNHSLGVVPGMIILKVVTGAASAWQVWHRSLASGFRLVLNTTAVPTNATAETFFGNNTVVVDPTSTQFTVGNASTVNLAASTVVAYLFAHDASATGIIQCGVMPLTGSVNLGWEPQYVLWKNGATNGWWNVVDTMRNCSATNSGTNETAELQPHLTSAESLFSSKILPTATGFTVNGATGTNTSIFVAIRRHNKAPGAGSDVYQGIARTGTSVALKVNGLSFKPDLVISTNRDKIAHTSATFVDKVRGKQYALLAQTANSEDATNNLTSWEADGFGVGVNNAVNAAERTYIHHCFRRMNGVFDIVSYTGTGAGANISHNLGVVPELIIARCRTASGSPWGVYAGPLANTEYLQLNNSGARLTDASYWNSTSPNALTFPLGTSIVTNQSGFAHVAYLFASKLGISKVGAYTGNGTNLTIDCGFTTGARFILIKRTNVAGDWFIWDTTRGIVAGNDPHIAVNTTTAEVTTNDTIDPASVGFIVNQVAATNVNVSAATYIYLAIA